MTNSDSGDPLSERKTDQEKEVSDRQRVRASDTKDKEVLKGTAAQLASQKRNRWDSTAPSSQPSHGKSDPKTKGLSISLNSGIKRPLPVTTPAPQSTQKTPKLAISLGSTKEREAKQPMVPLKQVSKDVQKIFNDEDDSEEEEIPEQYRIRMRNKGRDNPTACGPNSYGKSRLGFCDYRSIQEREIDEKAKKLCNE